MNHHKVREGDPSEVEISEEIAAGLEQVQADRYKKAWEAEKNINAGVWADLRAAQYNQRTLETRIPQAFILGMVIGTGITAVIVALI